MKHVLVTGGAGFLGSEFVKYHVAAGDDVVAIDDFSNPHARFPKGAYQQVRHDVTDLPTYLRLGNYDIVYHFAAPVGGRLKIEGDPMFNAKSLAIDAYIFRWLTTLDNPPLLVYPSSSAVYPIDLQRKDFSALLNEWDFNPRSDFWGQPDEMYGFTKMAGEVLAYKAAQYGLNTVVIRPFSGYGETQSLDYPFPSLMTKILNDDIIEVWGTGEQSRDFIHVDDIVGATVAYINNNPVGYNVYNICSGVGTSFNEFIEMGAKLFNRWPIVIKPLPDKPVGVYYRVGSPTKMQIEYGKPRVSLEEGMKRWLNSYM